MSSVAQASSVPEELTDADKLLADLEDRIDNLSAAVRVLAPGFEDQPGAGVDEQRRDVVGGQRRRLCVHRKGATRAFGVGHPELPELLRRYGQPVLVPGSMGTASYVLTGLEGGVAFAYACHGAGRVLSRHAAQEVRGATLRRELEAAGIAVRGSTARGLADEAPLSYKDIDEVVGTCDRARLARLAARLVPLGVVKG